MVLIKPHLFGEWVLTVILLLFFLFCSAFAWWIRPAAPDPIGVKDWTERPNQVWTHAEASELARQIREGDLRLPPTLLGPGPVALDRSASRNTQPNDDRLRMNALSADLNREYADQLIRGGPFELARHDYRIDGLPAGEDATAKADFAYLRALMAFRSGELGPAPRYLADAGCGQALGKATGNVADPSAAQRSLTLRCKWLDARLKLGERGAVDAATLSAAVVELRDALDLAMTGSPANGQVNGHPPRFTSIPVLDPSNYLMRLDEAGGASLWQDYLSALLLSSHPLCGTDCRLSASQERTEDGIKVYLLANHGKDLWEAYPELAVLTRILLLKAGDVEEARKIPLVVEDADNDATGFQFRKDGANVTLHPGYQRLATLAMMVGNMTPSQTTLSNDALKFWSAHADAREKMLSGQPEPANPFTSGSRQYLLYDDFQERWADDLDGKSGLVTVALYWASNGIVLAVFLYAIWFFLLGSAGLRARGKVSQRHYREIMGSWYFKGPGVGWKP